MKILKKWQRSFYKKMIKYHILSPKVIVMMDGGICSQMYQYLLGEIFRKKGYKIYYDLSFYEEWGSDIDCKFVRNYDILKLFPYLKVNKASKPLTTIYKQKYYESGNALEDTNDYSFLEKKPPLYLGGYYKLPTNIWIPNFKSTFKILPEILDKPNQQIYSEIKQCPCPVAVHVRRGDLKIERPVYGKPASLEYFQSAISYIQNNCTIKPFFYFFSDEPDWIYNELIPYSKLHLMENCKVVDINSSDKGYMDLILIAQCTHQITSKGSLGKYGALLNDNNNKIVVLCNDGTSDRWKERFYNPVLL